MVLFPLNHYNNQSSNHVFNSLWPGFVEFEHKVGYGIKNTPHSLSKNLQELISSNTKTAVWTNTIIGDDIQPLLENNTGKSVLAVLKKLLKTHVIVAPRPESLSQPRIEAFTKIAYSQLCENNVEDPQWFQSVMLKSERIAYTVDLLQTEQKQLTEIQNNISRRKDQLETQKEIPRILCSIGKTFEKRVYKILSQFDIVLHPYKNGDTEVDGILETDEYYLVFEFKSSQDKQITTKDAQQLLSRQASLLPTLFAKPMKLILVGNGEANLAPSERRDCFHENLRQSAKNNPNFRLISAIDLYDYFLEAEKGADINEIKDSILHRWAG